MKVSKKLLVLLVVLLTSFGFVACGGTTTLAPTTQAPTTEAPADLAAALEALKTNYADTLESTTFVATGDLTLVTTIGGATITWSSGNTDYLGNDGTVTAPTFTEGNQTVVLTVTLSNGVDTDVSYQFFVTIQATDKTDAERAEEVFLVVASFPTKEFWNGADSESLEFLTTGKDKDDASYDVVWTSSHPDVISVDGEITQPVDADVVVTMTATITIGGVAFTKDVVFTVAKLVPAEEYTTIAAMVAAAGADAADTNDENNHYIAIMGATVIARDSANSIYITDGTDILLVFGTSFDVAVGDVFDVYGEFVYYHGTPELQSTAIHPIRFEASTAAVTAAPVTTGATVASIVAEYAGVTPSNETPFSPKQYEITAKLFYNEEDGGNYSVYLVPVDYDFGAALSDAPKPNGSSIMIYYKSNMDYLKGLDGETITITIQLHGWRSDKLVWYADFFGDFGDITTYFADDATTAQVALDTALIGMPTDVPEENSFTVYTNIFGATIAYTSDNETLVDPVTGLIDASSLTDERITVTLTVTATVGVEVATQDVEINVGELPVTTLAAVDSLPSGTLVKVQGIIIDSTGNREYMIQDATGGLAIYEYDTETQALIAANVGNEVVLIATTGGYGGLIQISDIESLVVVNDEATMPAATNLDAATDWLPYQGMLIEANAMVVTSISGTDTGSDIYVDFVRLSDQLELTIKLSKYSDVDPLNEAVLTALEVGDVVNITGGLWWYNGPQILFTDYTVITDATATDAEKLAFDAAMFEATELLTGDYVLPTLMYSDATVVITGFTAVTDDLATTSSILVTRQAADEVGTFVFTLTLTGGTTTQDVTVNVTVKAILACTNVETFTNLTLGGSYDAGSFVGDNGITWAYTESRGDYTLDGKAIMLDKDGDGSSLSATLQGGISDFYIEFYDAFSGGAQLEVYINDELVGTSIYFDDDGDGSVFATLEITGLTVEGEFTIEILAAGSQMVLDNLSWNGYVVDVE